MNDISAKQPSTISYDLCCFCDASSQAYGTAVYLRSRISDVEITKTQLIFSKTRVSTKQTIPRLELLAVLIGTRALKYIRTQLDLDIHKVYLWTDSKCVLSWIKRREIKDRFVKNRVIEINSFSMDVRYVNTSENPADIASRGCTLKELKANDLWWKGPNWLTLESNNWPTWDEYPYTTNRREIITDDPRTPESRKKLKKEVVIMQEQTTSLITLTNYSSFTRLLRITAYVLRFCGKLTGKHSIEKGPILSSEEIARARIFWENRIQLECFESEIEDLKQGKESKLNKKLGLRIDEDGLIRCFGRYCYTDLPEQTKAPILLPTKHHYTDLLIDYVHNKKFHCGTSQTLAHIRKTHWIPNGRRRVSGVVYRCITCKRHSGGCFKAPLMGQLPTHRTKKVRSFMCIGIDYFGPIYVKEGKRQSKVWISLFCCTTTRAVHMEIVDSMTTQDFMHALRRFIARRGVPAEIITDNAKQFQIASSILSPKYVKSTSASNRETLTNIKWKFICPLAPWMGGFYMYERLVGVVKQSFKKVIRRAIMNKQDLHTLVVEVENVVNSRPLTYVGNEDSSFDILTPKDLVTYPSDSGVLEFDTEHKECYKKQDIKEITTFLAFMERKLLTILKRQT